MSCTMEMVAASQLETATCSEHTHSLGYLVYHMVYHTHYCNVSLLNDN